MLRVLLAKDLRRAVRNPWPWIINLALPLAIAGLIGFAFGGRSESGGLGRIRFAVVDEDDSVLTGLLRGAAHQGEGSKYLEPVFLGRGDALRLITENKLSAALIIPTNFTRHYLTGSETALELIKNPAQSIHPAVLEELLGSGVAVLNGLARNFQSEFPGWRAAFEGTPSYSQIGGLLERAGRKVEVARKFIDPPLVAYTKEVRAEAVPASSPGGGASINLFAYLMAGMVAMFLLFSAGTAMADLHREIRFRTLSRYQTLHEGLALFVSSKVLFTVVLLLLCGVILLGAGVLAFGIVWREPLALGSLTAAYAVFAAGLMSLLVAMMPDERRADVLINLVAMALGFVGGCAIPPQQLPAFLRDHVTPLMPSSWYAEAVRVLQAGDVASDWGWVAVRLIGLSVVLIGIAAVLFRRRFRKGTPA